MDETEEKKLRGYYKSLSQQYRLFERLKGGNSIRFGSIRPLFLEFQLLQKDFPEIVPFDISRDYKNEEELDFLAVMGTFSMILGRLEAKLEQPSTLSILEKREFSFIQNTRLRSIIERDYQEIQKALIANCWKSVIILSGGAIEAVLTDLLLSNQASALASRFAPSSKDIRSWDFSVIIDVAVDLKVVPNTIQKVTHTMREYRNLVHPGNEIRKDLNFDQEEAKIAVQVLHILHRDLKSKVI